MIQSVKWKINNQSTYKNMKMLLVKFLLFAELFLKMLKIIYLLKQMNNRLQNCVRGFGHQQLSISRSLLKKESAVFLRHCSEVLFRYQQLSHRQLLSKYLHAIYKYSFKFSKNNARLEIIKKFATLKKFLITVLKLCVVY